MPVNYYDTNTGSWTVTDKNERASLVTRALTQGNLDSVGLINLFIVIAAPLVGASQLHADRQRPRATVRARSTKGPPT